MLLFSSTHAPEAGLASVYLLSQAGQECKIVCSRIRECRRKLDNSVFAITGGSEQSDGFRVVTDTTSMVKDV
jgi:hypothetical protein